MTAAADRRQESSKRRRSSESGAVIVLVVFVTLVALFAIGLVVDAGRLAAVVRQGQNAADSASVNGVIQVRDFPTSKVQEFAWREVKRAVPASLKASPIFGCNGLCRDDLENEVFRFTQGNPTLNDDPGYDFDEGVTGNMTVTVTRGVFCYTPGGERCWFDLEGVADQFCHINSVEVTLKLRNIQTTFARLMGFRKMTTSTIRSVSYVNVPNTCGEDLCSVYGTVDADGCLLVPNPCI